MDKLLRSIRNTRIYTLYLSFKNGSKQLLKDGRAYYKFKPVKGEMYQAEQLIASYEFKRDLAKCAPIFVIFWIPFVGAWLALPLVYYFPQRLLSRQFWTDTQRIQAYDRKLLEARNQKRDILQHFGKAVDTIQDRKLVQLCHETANMALNEQELESENIKVIRRVFSMEALYLPTLSTPHRNSLAYFHSQDPANIMKYAIYISNVDRSLRHFGIESQTKPLLDLIAHQRGQLLNGATKENICTYIRNWLSLSNGIQERELGYLLYLPLFAKQRYHKKIKT